MPPQNEAIHPTHPYTGLWSIGYLFGGRRSRSRFCRPCRSCSSSIEMESDTTIKLTTTALKKVSKAK